MRNLNKMIVLLLGVMTLLFASCAKEGCEDPNANNFDAEAKKDCGCCLYPVINVNTSTTGGPSGDFTGSGGTASKTFTFQNNSTTAEYNMDITGTLGSSAQMIIKDANGTEVANFILKRGETADSKSSVSTAGTPGTWTVTVSVTDFNGDGSYSISQGT